MRRVRSLEDVQIVLNEILDWKQLQETKDTDMRGLQIKNMGMGTGAADAVTVRQLQDEIEKLKLQIRRGVL